MDGVLTQGVHGGAARRCSGGQITLLPIDRGNLSRPSMHRAGVTLCMAEPEPVIVIVLIETIAPVPAARCSGMIRQRLGSAGNDSKAVANARKESVSGGDG